MIDKLQAKKRILEDALQDAYRDLGKAYAEAQNSESIQVCTCLTRTLNALDKIRNINIAIAEIESVEHVYYEVPAPAVPTPIEPAPKDSSEDFPF